MILVVGANGMLGRDLMTVLAQPASSRAKAIPPSGSRAARLPSQNGRTLKLTRASSFR